jgi:hypothetical protein
MTCHLCLSSSLPPHGSVQTAGEICAIKLREQSPSILSRGVLILVLVVRPAIEGSWFIEAYDAVFRLVMSLSGCCSQFDLWTEASSTPALEIKVMLGEGMSSSDVVAVAAARQVDTAIAWQRGPVGEPGL